MKDQKYVRPAIWILFAVVMNLVIVGLIVYGTIFYVKSLFYRAPNSPATMAGALDYLEDKYDRRDFELKLLKVNKVEAYEEQVPLFDGAYYLRDAPARTETCYLGYSPQDDLYFYVFHSTDPEANSAYSSTLRMELSTIRNFEEAKTYAHTVFGNRFKGTDVHFYTQANSPDYNVKELKPLYNNPNIDARSAYNRLLLDIEDPFSTSFKLLHINRERFLFMPILYLNVYVDYSLEEFNTVMKKEAPNFEEISRYMLFFTNDGVYNRPYLNH